MAQPVSLRIAVRVAAMWAALVFAAAPAAAADLFAAPGTGASNEPIEITADRLDTNNTEKYAEFSGSVKATQGTFSITSDTLRIYYEGDPLNPAKEKSSQGSVKKIVASGRVHIVSDQYVADAEHAEYVTETDVMTLSGKNSQVVSGKNTLSGSKIVLNRKEGKASVEGGAAERVKAVLYQEGKNPIGLDSGKPAAPKTPTP
jgi:lipopolysaccharide export system protein LptA